MTKGAWVVVGVFVFYGLILWTTVQNDFLQGNVWHEGRIMEADHLTTKIDFLGLRVAKVVEQTTSAVFTCLVIAFIYLAIKMRRVERRLAEVEQRVTREKPS
jgi:hypothetical protein